VISVRAGRTRDFAIRVWRNLLVGRGARAGRGSYGAGCEAGAIWSGPRRQADGDLLRACRRFSCRRLPPVHFALWGRANQAHDRCLLFFFPLDGRRPHRWSRPPPYCQAIWQGLDSRSARAGDSLRTTWGGHCRGGWSVWRLATGWISAARPSTALGRTWRRDRGMAPAVYAALGEKRARTVISTTTYNPAVFTASVPAIAAGGVLALAGRRSPGYAGTTCASRLVEPPSGPPAARPFD